MAAKDVHRLASYVMQILEASFPLDAVLPELHAKNVLSDYEFSQLLPTPQSALVDRNRKFFYYLAHKDPSTFNDTLSSILSRDEIDGYYRENLRQLFGAEGKEGEGMRGRTSRGPQQGGESGSGGKEVSTLRPSHTASCTSDWTW